MSRRCHLIPLTALRLLWLMLVASPMGPAPAQSWTETTWEDFADGQFDAAGQNLYASHDGSLRSIHRFDLNQDGQLDLIFNNTHDTTAFLDATLAHFAADRTLATSPLAVRGSLRGTAADLNQDGHADLVFLPNRSGVQAPRRFLTVIWGGADGWPAHRSNEALPVYEPADMAVADLNADQWPDLVVLSHRPSYTGLSPAREMVVRIFWGGEQGYSLLRYKDVAVPLATALTSGDFDQDDVTDVALLTQEGHLLVGWGRDGDNELSISPQPLFESPIAGAQCLESHELDTEGAAALIVGTDRKAIVATRCDSARAWRPWQTLAPLSATGLAIGDLDGDQQPDLVATHLTTTHAMGGERGAAAGAGTVRVLWGSPEGYDAQRTLELQVPFAHAAAIGDVDGDRHADLAVAVYQGESTFAAASQIFFGNGHRALTPSPSGVATSGATDVMIVPVRGRTAANVVFCNSQGGTLDERVPLQIYWGGERGFDPAQMDEIPFTSGYEASAADLNADGFVDLIAMNSGHGVDGPNPGLGANIFWGSEQGFTAERRTVLRERSLGSSHVADLDRDGYLDLALGAFETHEEDVLTIYYGSADGFSRDRRVTLPSSTRSIGASIADYNHDDWLDIAVVDSTTHRVRIFWGSGAGFDAERRQELEVPMAIDFETADLNADGHLDLIVGSYADPNTNQRDTGIYIYWGGDAGYSAFNRQWLPGMTPIGLTVADFDDDGWLDLFSPHYHGNGMREAIACYLYWGGPDGLHSNRKTVLICDSPSDALAGDFNNDGLLDLAVASHTRHGDHKTRSLVFYNDGRRFEDPQVTRLPTHGTHWMYFQDLGHIHDRSYQQTYVSSVFQWEHAATAGRLTNQARTPTGTRLTFEVQSASAPDRLDQQSWRTLDDEVFTLDAQDRCLRYRAVLHSDNGDRFPIVEEVRITLTADR